MSNPDPIRRPGFTGKDDPRRWKFGRGKGKIQLPDIIRRIAAEPISPEDKRTKLEAVVRVVYANAAKGDIKAAEFIADRGWGKPVQPVDQKTAGTLKVTQKNMSDAELKAEIAALERKIRDLDGADGEAQAIGDPGPEAALPA